MALPSATNSLEKIGLKRVDRLFLRMNHKEISIVSSVMRHSRRRPLSALVRATNSLCNGWIYLLLVDVYKRQNEKYVPRRTEQCR